jgi:phospholipid/cholesterol/gamma-HCH transport system ATP-binding protein
MIDVKHIRKSFGEKVILQDISTTLQTGKCNLIIGTSGSGKTVFMKILIGLFPPDSGEICYDGVDMVTMSDEERKQLRQQIGMLFQGSALFDSQTVEENVGFPLQMFTNMSYRERKKRVNEVLAKVNLKEANKKYPAEISGGMMKRVGIARAIVMNPKYLFCDEPNSGLDPQTSGLIDELIHDITIENNITTVINTHDMNSVMSIGDHILFMTEGLKQWEGTKDDIIFSKNNRLNDFIFASEFLQDAKAKRMEEVEEKK